MVGSTKGYINLNVHQSSDSETHNAVREDSAQIKTNAIKTEEFGEYVTRMHALNNKGFINQFQVSIASSLIVYMVALQID